MGVWFQGICGLQENLWIYFEGSGSYEGFKEGLGCGLVQMDKEWIGGWVGGISL